MVVPYSTQADDPVPIWAAFALFSWAIVLCLGMDSPPLSRPRGLSRGRLLSANCGGTGFGGLGLGSSRTIQKMRLLVWVGPCRAGRSVTVDRSRAIYAVPALQAFAPPADRDSSSVADVPGGANCPGGTRLGTLLASDPIVAWPFF
jgi:hypothetical protein